MSSSFSVINGDREIEHDRFEGDEPNPDIWSKAAGYENTKALSTGNSTKPLSS